MAIIDYPVKPAHQSVELQPIAPAYVNRSELTHARQALDTGYSWWVASVAVVPMRLPDARAWRVFAGRVRGATHSFRLPVTGPAQHSEAITVRAAGAASGYSLPTDGWQPSTTLLLAGDYVTVGNQLMVLDADVVADAGGLATLQFHSPLRGTIADNTVIETKEPFLLASFPEHAPALTLGLADIQAGFSFSVEEAY